MAPVLAAWPRYACHAVTKYKSEIWDSCKALWAVWIPAQLVNFGIVPRHLRIPYVAAVSFGWTVIFRCAQAGQGAEPRAGTRSRMHGGPSGWPSWSWGDPLKRPLLVAVRASGDHCEGGASEMALGTPAPHHVAPLAPAAA